MEIYPFFLPIPVLFGSGISKRTGEEAKNLGCKRPLVLYDRGIEAAGIAQRIVDSVTEAGLECVTNNTVESDPSDLSIDAIADFAKANHVDSIIAVGGGSTIDSAKCVKFLLSHPGELRHYLGYYPGDDTGVPLISIPTTAGTGSEVTIGAIVTDTATNTKVSVANMFVKSALAIVDPELTQGCPSHITAACAFDVLAHIIEGCTSNHTSPLTQTILHSGISLFMKSFPRVCQDGSDMQARSDMHMASLIGGIAILNGYVQVGHSFAHTIGAVYHVPHGAACSMFTGPCLEYVADIWPEEVGQIAALLEVPGAAGASAKEAARGISRKLYEMARAVGLPQITDVCPEEAQAAPQVIPIVLEDSLRVYSPREVDEAGARWILHRAYELAAEYQAET